MSYTVPICGRKYLKMKKKSNSGLFLRKWYIGGKLEQINQIFELFVEEMFEQFSNMQKLAGSNTFKASEKYINA